METLILSLNKLAEQNGPEIVIWMIIVSVICGLLLVDKMLPN